MAGTARFIQVGMVAGEIHGILDGITLGIMVAIMALHGAGEAAGMAPTGVRHGDGVHLGVGARLGVAVRHGVEVIGLTITTARHYVRIMLDHAQPLDVARRQTAQQAVARMQLRFADQVVIVPLRRHQVLLCAPLQADARTQAVA